MPILLLVRHGHSTANADGILSGRMPGVELTERGVTEAAAAGAALAGMPLSRVVSSPLDRCQATAQAVVDAQAGADRSERPEGWTPPALETDERLVECGYGAWTGRALKDLVKEPLWRTVQAQPSAARFPDADPAAGSADDSGDGDGGGGGYLAESLGEVSARAVGAVRALDAEVEATYGADAVWVAVSHGDVIKAILADAAGVHLDQFQRFVVESGSLAAVRYTAYRPFLLGVNADPARIAALVASSGHRADGEATPGGTASGEEAQDADPAQDAAEHPGERVADDRSVATTEVAAS